MPARGLGFRAFFALIAACLAVFVAASASYDPDRETWQPPEQIMDMAGVKPGMKIGEAGAGTGYLTFHLASRVGEGGIVFANEISEMDLSTIRARADREGVANIVTVLGEVEDPLFPENELDMVIMVYVLHHLEHPISFMKALKSYLKPGAPVVIVERNTHQDRSHYPEFMTNDQILETIQQSGYELERTETSLPKDTIYIFKINR